MATAIATTNGNGGLPALLGKEKAQAMIAPFLPEGVSYDRVVAAAQIAAANNPEIMQCTPASIVLSVAKIMQWGLEIGETAHIVPFNVNVAPKGQTKQWEKRATPIADYKGLAQLMIASKCVRHVEAFCVHENDGFEYQQGSEARLWHSPVSDPKARGKLKGAYVILHLPFGVKVFDYMAIEDIDEIRHSRSKQWKEGACPRWYAKKTVVRQASKLVPKDPRLAKVFAVMEQDAAEEFGGASALTTDDDDEIPGVPARPRLASGETEMGAEWTEDAAQAELLSDEPESKPYEMD